MTTTHIGALGVILILASACAGDASDPVQASLRKVTGSAALRRGVNPAKLDAVLARIPVEGREQIRELFTESHPIVRAGSTIPELQALFDDIYADETRRFVKRTTGESRAWKDPFVLALADGPEDLVRIVRGPSREKDVLVISSNAADVAHLTAAIRVLGLARSRWDVNFTDDHVLEARIGNPPSQAPQSWADFAESQLARARTATPREIVDVGRVRSVVVTRPTRNK